MAKTIKVIGPTQKLIKVIGPTQKLVKPDVVAKALGAEKVGIKIDTKQGPLSLFSFASVSYRQIAFYRRSSRIGRNCKRNEIKSLSFRKIGLSLKRCLNILSGRMELI